ncbi:AAA family ATPase [Streptomyces sp. NBC_00663]|uniref:AAA family ATPase n=1 Tax=Streptomyces sp. NBC_00663 TaxID=2975801 RepID=UPI002E3374D3|nr:AAA family ATPase [Streptomyces sp. NBC_00663]
MSSGNAPPADGTGRRTAPPGLRLHLLGGFRAEREGGAPVAGRWPRPSARRLVELLAVSPGRTRHREEIIEMCWPETAGTPAALGSLRVALHAARRALEPELPPRAPSAYLVSEGALLRLPTETVWIDADHAESLAEQALHATDHPPPAGHGGTTTAEPTPHTEGPAARPPQAGTTAAQAPHGRSTTERAPHGGHTTDRAPHGGHTTHQAPHGGHTTHQAAHTKSRADQAPHPKSRAPRTPHAGSTAELARALEAFRGELLPEHRYTPWVQARRERLDALRDSVRLALAEACLADGQTERAAAVARAVLADSAAEERAHRVLIGAWLRQGMRRRALAQYHQCRRALDAEWGVLPGPETEALHRAALGTDTPPVRHHPAPVRPTPPPAVLRSLSEAPFVGRRAELERLLNPARPALSVVGGEAGIGKTRLAAEAARRAAANGAAVLWGAGHDEGPQAPYGMFVEALEGWLAGRSTTDRARIAAEYPELAALLPSLGQVGPGPGRVGGPEYERERIFSAVSGLLTIAADPGTVGGAGALVVLDDVHAADLASLRLLARLARRTPSPSAPRLRFLATYRPEDLPETDPRRALLDTLVRQGTAHRLRLRRLGRGECLTLAAEVMPAAPDTQAALHRVWELSLGHPLFALELAKAPAQPPAAHEDLTAPEGIRLLVNARLSRLSPAARRVIEVVAVASGGVATLAEVEELAQVTQVEEPAGAGAPAPLTAPARVVDGIEAALAAAVLEERSVPADGVAVPGLGFRHPLIRLVCREGLSRARRRQLHAAYAESLLRRRPGAVDAVAAHLAGADDPRAADHLHRAARRAAAVGADDSADHYYGELTARLDAVAVEAARIRLDHAAVLRRMARHEDAVRVLREALTDLHRHGTPAEQAAAAARLAESLAKTGAPQEGLRLLDTHRPPQDAPPRIHADHHLARGLLCFVTGDYEGSLTAARQAEKMAAGAGGEPAPQGADGAPEASLLARALAQQSTSLALTGRLPQARTAADAALPHAEAHGDPRLLAAVLSILREHARRSGRLHEAVATGRRALDLADRCGDPEAAAFERANLAEVHLLLGEFTEAATLATEAVDEAQAHAGWCLPYALTALARVQLRGGPRRPGLPGTRELLTRAAHCLTRRPDRQAEYEVRTAQAELALRDVRPDRALALLSEVSGTGVPVLAAWAHLTAGEPVRAAEVAAAEAARAAGAGEAVTECEARTAQAAALALLGRTEEAAGCATRVRELAETLPYPTVLRRVAYAKP